MATAQRAKPINKWAALATVCMALWVIAINTTAINTAVGEIADDLELSTSTLSWAINSYVLAAAAFVVIGGQVGDVLGRKQAFLIGIAVFAVGSGLNASAESGAMLIAGRGTQGLGSAFMMPSTMSIISTVFPPEERGTALGIWGAVGGLGFSFGPLYGGFFADVLSWRGIFLSDFVWLGLGAVMTLTFLRGLPSEASETKVDRTGAPLLVGGLFLFVLGIQQGQNWGWTSPAIIGSLTLAVLLLGSFWVVEHRKAQPMIHFELFRLRRFVGGNVGTFVNAMGLFGLLYFFNLWVQAPVLLDLSALRASVLLLPYGLAMLVFSFLGGRIADRIGYAVPLTVGFLAMAVGYLLLTRVSTSTADTDLLPALTILGFGVGVTFSTSSAAGMVAVPAERAGEASGVINMFRYMGGVLVIAVGTMLYVGAATDQLDDALTTAGVAETDDAALDRALVSSTEDFEAEEGKLSGEEKDAFEEGAAQGITDGFRLTSWLGAGAGLVAALASAVLFREPTTEHARRYSLRRREIAGLANPDQPQPR